MSVKLPWQKPDDSPSNETPSTPGSVPGAETADAVAAGDAVQQEKLPKGYTPPKGRPTPRRREVEIERGVLRDPSGVPRNQSEAAARRKELKKSMSKEEWKDYKRKEREETRRRQREAQAAMDRGEEKFLLPRDKGEVRRYVRDWVDSRRFVSNAVMPVALVVLLVMLLGSWLPTLANVISLGAMVLILIFLIEGIWLGKSVNKSVRAKFPGTTETGFALGFYAYSRATQPRKWRTPKPRVKIGDQV